MTIEREDLKEVNAALRELVRLQLAGELSPHDAWLARREMLASVEAAWNDLSQDLTPEALASKQELKLTDVTPPGWRQRLQQLPRWRPALRWQPRLRWPPLTRLLAHLPWWPLFLLAALATFYYVSTL